MSRRKYYVCYWRDFGNTYNLYYTDKEIDRDDYERITRKEAIRMCVEEKERQRTDPAFSGYASATIMPYEYDGTETDIWNDKNYYLDGYIWERRTHSEFARTYGSETI